jgi:hypothetical protein
MFPFLNFFYLYCQIRATKFAQLAGDAIFGSNRPGFAARVQLQYLFGTEVNTDTTPFAPVGIDHMDD